MTESMDTYFMDVGQGDCTYIEVGTDGTPNKECYLIDFGFKQRQFNGDHPAQQTFAILIKLISDASKARGKSGPFIDHLFITHPHADHWNMLAALVSGDLGDGVNHWAPHWHGAAKTLAVGTLTFGGDASAYMSGAAKNAVNWATIIAAATPPGGVPAVTPLGDRAHQPQDGLGNVAPTWTGLGGALNIYLISANIPARKSGGANPKSLCLIFAYDGMKVMLLGDAEAPDLKAYLEAWYPWNNHEFLQCDVLKLAHHGSKRGTPDWWGKVVRAGSVFASGGYFWAHPYREAYDHANAAGTVATGVLDHWFASSSGDYVSESTTHAVFSSIWYVVTAPGPVSAKDQKGVVQRYGAGMYTGVAWLLQKDKGAPARLAFSPEDVWPGAGQVPV